MHIDFSSCHSGITACNHAAAAGSVVHRPSRRARRRKSVRGANRAFLLAATVPVFIASLPSAARAQCGSEVLTQSTNSTIIGPSSVWCGTLTFSAETQVARAFTASQDLTLRCVTFGVSQNTGADWPCQVRLLRGTIATPYTSLTLLTQTTVTIPAGAANQLFTVPIPAVLLPSGTSFIVELDTPTRDPAAGGDGALLALGFNPLGESAPSYLRAVPCGVSEYVTLASLGFGDRYLLLSVGADQGLIPPVLGGFPISPIGNATLSHFNGEVSAIGTPGSGPIGLSINYGNLTMGAGATFSAIGTGNETGATVAIEFHGATTRDRLIFRDNPANSSQAVLDLDFDTPGFEFFDLHVYNNGVLVGVIPHQSSGTVVFKDPGVDIWKWLRNLINAFNNFCTTTKLYTGTVQTGVKVSYTLGTGQPAAAASISGGPQYIGNQFSLFPVVPATGGEPPVSVNVVTTGIPGIAVNVSNAAPSVNIGNAETRPRAEGNSHITQIGASFAAIKENGVNMLIATDFSGDGVADLRVIPNASSGPPAADDGVLMQLGGAVSASIEMSILQPAGSGACLMVCSRSVGPFTIPVWTAFDPWPTHPELIALRPDFTGIGNGLYTLKVFDPAGVLVYQQMGLQGIGGGSSQWPNKGGKLGGQTPCFTFCYPSGTTFRTAAGPTFPVHEVRVLAEQAGPAPLLASLQFAATNMGELQLFTPVVELPAFGCYANCDNSTVSPVLNVNDFICFQNRFAAGDSYANCDGSTLPPVLNVNDFVCYQNRFAAGCP